MSGKICYLKVETCVRTQLYETYQLVDKRGRALSGVSENMGEIIWIANEKNYSMKGRR